MSKKNKQNKSGSKKPANKQPAPKFNWDDMKEIRTFVIEMIQKPHEELINLKNDCGVIIERDEDLINTYNGLNSTFIDQLQKASEITKEHSSTVKNEKGEEILQFETGEIPVEDVDQAMKYIAIGQKYNTLRESVEHTATVGVMNFINAIDRTHRKLVQQELGLTDEQVAQIEAEEEAKEESIKNFKETYNGETLKDDFPKALSDASKGKSKFEERSEEDVSAITADFQEKINNMSKEDVEKGGGINIVPENKEK